MTNRKVLGNWIMMTSLSQAAIAGALIFLVIGCARPAPAPSENGVEKTLSDTQSPDGDSNRTTVFGPPRLSRSELDRFLKKARTGDADAMHTLSTHYFGSDEVSLGYHWLRQAAKLGDCDAILHLVENDFRGVTPEEMPHWQKEKERLGCDPEKHARAKPIIRIRPDPEPEP